MQQRDGQTQEIGFGDDADEFPVIIKDRQTAVLVAVQDFRRFPEKGIGRNCFDIRLHDVADQNGGFDFCLFFLIDFRKMLYRITEEIPVCEQPDEMISVFGHGNVADLGKLHEGAHVLKGIRAPKRKHSVRHQVADINHICSP